MAELVFFTGTMDCGKSTLALQMDHTHSARGRQGLLFTQHDRSGEAVLSSRLGLTKPALEVDVVLEPRAWEPGPTISNSFGFGGHNGSLVLGPA